MNKTATAFILVITFLTSGDACAAEWHIIESTAQKMLSGQVLKGDDAFIISKNQHITVGNALNEKITISGPFIGSIRTKLGEQLALWKMVENSTHLSPIINFIKLYKTGPVVKEAQAQLTSLKHKLRFEIYEPYVGKNSFQDCSDCPIMVIVPGGNFAMGDLVGDGGTDEIPVHRINISQSFAVGKFEVTFSEYEKCIADGECKLFPQYTSQQKGNHPVVNVSWLDAKNYLSWLSKKAGKPYRLLTEAEWEFAARAGTLGNTYWQQTNDNDCKFSNSADLSSKSYFKNLIATDCHDGQIFSASVGSYQPNAFGLYDVIGNVFEWTEDCWHPTFDNAPNNGMAWVGHNECSAHVLRGGAWTTMPQDLRVSFRLWLEPDNISDTYGFRVARETSDLRSQD